MKTPIFKKLKNLRDNLRFLQHHDLREACSIHAEELLAFRRYVASLPPIKIPKILTIEETAEMLVSTDKSIARYGDGEFLLMNNEGIPFQDADERLGYRLREIIREPPASCEVAIGRAYWYYEDRVREYAKEFAIRFMRCYGDFLDRHLDFSRTYYDTTVTQFYQVLKGIDMNGLYGKFRDCWRGKDVLIVCGESAVRDFKYDIYDTAASKSFVFGPNKNAWACYDPLLNEVKAKAEGKLVLIMLGPTATVMAADLSAFGFRALDIGHLAKDYNAFCCGTKLNSPDEASDWFGT